MYVLELKNKANKSPSTDLLTRFSLIANGNYLMFVEPERTLYLITPSLLICHSLFSFLPPCHCLEVTSHSLCQQSWLQQAVPVTYTAFFLLIFPISKQCPLVLIVEPHQFCRCCCSLVSVLRNVKMVNFVLGCSISELGVLPAHGNVSQHFYALSSHQLSPLSLEWHWLLMSAIHCLCFEWNSMGVSLRSGLGSQQDFTGI